MQPPERLGHAPAHPVILGAEPLATEQVLQHALVAHVGEPYLRFIGDLGLAVGQGLDDQRPGVARTKLGRASDRAPSLPGLWIAQPGGELAQLAAAAASLRPRRSTPRVQGMRRRRPDENRPNKENRQPRAAPEDTNESTVRALHGPAAHSSRHSNNRTSRARPGCTRTAEFALSGWPSQRGSRASRVVLAARQPR